MQAFSVYYLVELRSLLLDFTSDSGQSATVSARKITPIKSMDFAPAFEKRDIQVCFRQLFVALVNGVFVYLFSVVLLSSSYVIAISLTVSLFDFCFQKQLEDSFFSLHSSSLLQTVAFTSDRVASNFVKTFQSTVLSENLEHCQSKAKEEAQRLVSNSVADDSKIQVRELQNYVLGENMFWFLILP